MREHGPCQRLRIPANSNGQRLEPVKGELRAVSAARNAFRGPRIVDFEALPQDPGIWAVDAVICALGTTIKAAGSRERFHRVDHDYPLEIARLAKAHGARSFVLNSAKGADVKSLFFYSRVKGETERDIVALGFDSCVIVRPGLIDGPRPEPRPMEQGARKVLGLLKPILPPTLRPNPPEAIARIMLEAAIAAPRGVTVVPSQDML